MCHVACHENGSHIPVARSIAPDPCSDADVGQVVEAALKSADMDVASVDFLVLHQVR